MKCNTYIPVIISVSIGDQKEMNHPLYYSPSFNLNPIESRAYCNKYKISIGASVSAWNL